jgi:phage terminase large subunit-like protein
VKASPTIVEALEHPDLWRRWLRDDPSTWSAWFAFLRALFGLMLSKAELKIFQECTGRTTPRAGGYLEATLIIGRRGGKSLVLAICAVFLAVFKKWPGVAGERKVIIVCASTARQARSIHNYCRALITEVPALAPMLIRETATELDLDNGISIVIEVADYRSVRGTSICAALLDEVAFWQAEGASPDKEVVTAV